MKSGGNNIMKILGIVGVGQMGRGIAQVAAMSNYQVILFDQLEGAANKAKEFIENQFKKGIDKGKWKKEQTDSAIKNIILAKEIKELSHCAVIIEAICEDITIKSELFKTLDALSSPETILASNTSSISITHLGSVTNRPDKVIGMHFMNPVPVMKLVEAIQGLRTSDKTVEVIKNLSADLGKTFVQVRDIPGFAVNRILMPMINEAIYTLYEGIASIQDIDTAMKLGTNVPMGPLQLADFIGLDTCLSIMDVLYQGLGDSKYRACPLLRQYVSANLLGQKTKRGFYEY